MPLNGSLPVDRGPLPDRPSKTKILVVEDHPIFLKGLTSLLRLELDLEVVSEARDRQQAIDAVDAVRPDVALVDLSLGDDNGLDLIKDILHRAPGTRILVLSMHEEALYSKRAFAAGALGFCGKGQDVALLLEAIRTVANGNFWPGPEAIPAGRGVDPDDLPDRELQTLSDRELEVFRLIGMGQGTTEIASKLHIGVKTVDTYKGNLKSKLGCHGSHELRRMAVGWVAREKRL